MFTTLGTLNLYPHEEQWRKTQNLQYFVSCYEVKDEQILSNHKLLISGHFGS